MSYQNCIRMGDHLWRRHMCHGIVGRIEAVFQERSSSKKVSKCGVYLPAAYKWTQQIRVDMCECLHNERHFLRQ